MNITVLTLLLPPRIRRSPLRRPLSRLKGATPVSEAISFGESLPNSGCSATIQLSRYIHDDIKKELQILATLYIWWAM